MSDQTSPARPPHRAPEKAGRRFRRRSQAVGSDRPAGASTQPGEGARRPRRMCGSSPRHSLCRCSRRKRLMRNSSALTSWPQSLRVRNSVSERSWEGKQRAADPHQMSSLGEALAYTPHWAAPLAQQPCVAGLPPLHEHGHRPPAWRLPGPNPPPAGPSPGQGDARPSCPYDGIQRRVAVRFPTSIRTPIAPEGPQTTRRRAMRSGARSGAAR